VLPLVKKYFAKMSDRSAPTTTTPGPRPQKPSFTWVSDPGAQVDLRLSFKGLSARDKDAAALNLLSRVLGEGLSSRLHSDLIDKKGLAYSLSAGPEMFADCGSYDFDVAVAPEKAVSTMKALLAFASDAIKHPPTKAELRDAKDRYTIALDFMVDAPADLALWSARNTLQNIDPDFQHAAERFLSVSPEDCARVARRVFDRDALIAIGVGDLGKTERQALQSLMTR
jgi:predicted Zn-dependent peptidase